MAFDLWVPLETALPPFCKRDPNSIDLFCDVEGPFHPGIVPLVFLKENLPICTAIQSTFESDTLRKG